MSATTTTTAWEAIMTRSNLLIDIIVREAGRIVMQFSDLTVVDADAMMSLIAPVPGRSINRVEHF